MQSAVIGLGRFGAKLAMTLFALGGEVLAIDSNREAVERIKDHVSHVAIADCTDELAMRDLGVQDMDVVIIAIGEKVETSILTTAILRRLGCPRIMSRSVSRMQGQILMDVGAHEVFSLEEQMGEQMARKLAAPQILDSITLSSGHSMVDFAVPDEFVGKTLKELNLRARFGINIIAVKRRIPAINERGENIVKVTLNDLPSPDEKITADDVLVAVGSDAKLEAMTSSLAREVSE